MAVGVLLTPCLGCPPCEDTGEPCAIERRTKFVDHDGWAEFTAPNIVGEFDAVDYAGGAPTSGSLGAVATGDWARVNYKDSGGTLQFFKFYRALGALASGAAYVGILGFWKAGVTSFSAGDKIRRRNVQTGSSTYYTANGAITPALHDDPASDAVNWTSAGSGAFVAEFLINAWSSDVFGATASVPRSVGAVQPIGDRPWFVGSETRTHHSLTTSPSRTCSRPNIYTPGARRFLTWIDTTVVTLSNGSTLTGVRTWSIDPVTHTVSYGLTGDTTLALPSAPSIANGVAITDLSTVLNVESWRYPELPIRGTRDGLLAYYATNHPTMAAACGAYYSGLTAHDWANRGSPDSTHDAYALTDYSVTATTVSATFVATVPWFRYDIDPRPNDPLLACSANPTGTNAGNGTYGMPVTVTQTIELTDEYTVEDASDDATAAMSGSWTSAGAGEKELCGHANILGSWVDGLPAVRVNVMELRARHTQPVRYYLVTDCGEDGVCQSFASSPTEVTDPFPPSSEPANIVITCNATCAP